MNWISVEDRLPEKGQLVICVRKDYNEFYSENLKTMVLRVSKYVNKMPEYFSHWAPLEELPK